MSTSLASGRNRGALVNWYSAGGKRLLDIVIAAAALIVLSPILIVCGLLIKLDDRGPIIYRQMRIGRKERPFALLKLRTMPTSNEVVPSAHAGALRTTRVGHWLRRLSIDELPQLVNIIKGEMSIVGPRPALPAQTRLIHLRAEQNVYDLLPGLTGLAQIHGYDAMPETEKAEFDARYRANVSLVGDLRIILSTFRYLLKPPPRY
jgi:O-antigen biosynthesis protein WbqP